MTYDELPFSPPTTDANPAAVARKCPHPRASRVVTAGEDAHTLCGRCGHRFDPAVIRRGRTSRRRGNDFERELARRLGLRRVGQYGGPDDLRDGLFAAQAKVGGAFPERLWRWLKAVPVEAGQTPLLVIGDSPGAGHRRRALVVVDIDDWRALHGPEETL